MKKRLVQTLIASVMVSSLVVTPVFATPSVDELKEKKAAAQNEVDSLQSELNTLMTKLNDLGNKLYLKGEEITQAEGDLKAAEKKQKKQYEDMKLRIQYMYEDGDSSALERVATSGSIAEMLSQVEYVQKVHTYDRDKLEEYEDTVKEVEDLKTTLVEEQQNLENLQTEYTAQSEELQVTIDTKSDEVENLDDMLQEAAKAAAEAQRKAAEEAAKKAEAERQQQEQQQQTGGGNDSGGGNGSGGGNDFGGGNDSGGGNYTPEPSYNASTGNAVVDRAYSWVNRASYVWGACSPGAFDCSGFVSYCLTGVYSRLGTTYTFLEWPQVSNPQPGDVCVNAEHCGIYIGGGMMIHAADEKSGVISGPVQAGMIYVRY